MGRFAAATDVSVEKSKIEIERLLTRYGASRFASGWDEAKAVIQFESHGRRIKFVLPLPPVDDYRKTSTGRVRHNQAMVRDAWEQGCRSLWRALALVIKAKLEAVESGVSTFETEFGMVTVLPNGRTVGEMIAPQISDAYATGKMPPLLGMGDGA